VTPRKPQDQGRQHLQIDSQKSMFASIIAQPQGGTTIYLWIFSITMKLRFQRTQNQVDRRFVQADMAELPKVARSENFWKPARAETKRLSLPHLGSD
jgi:hypothetical protein